MIQFVKKSLQFIISIGILPNLQPGYGIDFELRSHHYHKLAPEIVNEPEKLNRLEFCTKSLRTLYEHYDQFRIILLSNHLNDILCSLIQLSFKNDAFVDQLNWFFDQIHKPILIKELMLLQSNKMAPVPLKRFLSRTLNRIMVSSPDGFHSLIRVILDSATAISTPTPTADNQWKQIDILVRLFLKQNNNYLVAIKNQLFDLINTNGLNNQIDCDDIVRILALLMKYLWKNQNFEMFDQFLEPITRYTLLQQPETLSSDHFVVNEHIISVLYFVFVYDAETISPVPISKLQPPKCYQTLLEIFSRISAKQSKFRNKISDILSKIVDDERHVINFDNFLFSTNRNNDTIFDLMNCLIAHFFNEKNRKIIQFFDYLLSKLMQNCYNIEHKMIFLQILAQLTDNPLILQHLKNEPKSLIEFFRLFLEKSVQQRFHQSDNNHDANYQNLFVILVFLKTVIEHQMYHDSFSNGLLDQYRVLITVLDDLKTNSFDTELKSLAEQLADWISKKSTPPHSNKIPEKSDNTDKRRRTAYENVLDDVFSAEDYVRGHGLIQLTKMLQNNDVEASANRQYLMYLFIVSMHKFTLKNLKNLSRFNTNNIFRQQNLQSNESYVYLSAINGLVAVADQYSEVVVNTLTEEYLNISQRVQLDDEIRVKLGEALVRISKLLGEMAITFKKRLIHTFLCGCRDSNPVFRTSSLSNLAEVCRVLNFKLGDSLIEVY